MDRPRYAQQLPVDLLVQLVTTVLVDEIPLVECDDQSPSGFGDHREHTLVLLADDLAGIDEHHGHLGRLDGSRRAQARVVLRTAGGTHLATQARGVHQQPRLATDLYQTVDRVHSGPRDSVHDRPFLIRQPVEQ